MPEPDKDLIRTVFVQLMEHIRKQDDLIHSWTKYYLSIQAALAVALSFLMKLGPGDGILVNTGSVFIPLLGIVTSIRLTNIILRESMWQGRYIAQIRRLPELPETYREDWAPANPDPKRRGYVAHQFWWLRNTLVVGWAVWGFVSVYRAVFGPGVMLPRF